MSQCIMKIDLHTHTTHSDGQQSVAELLQKAENAKLDYLSITDHDTISAYKELEDPKIRSLFSGKIINGIEIIFEHHRGGPPVEKAGLLLFKQGYGLPVLFGKGKKHTGGCGFADIVAHSRKPSFDRGNTETLTELLGGFCGAD